MCVISKAHAKTNQNDLKYENFSSLVDKVGWRPLTQNGYLVTKIELIYGVPFWFNVKKNTLAACLTNNPSCPGTTAYDRKRI